MGNRMGSFLETQKILFFQYRLAERVANQSVLLGTPRKQKLVDCERLIQIIVWRLPIDSDTIQVAVGGRVGGKAAVIFLSTTNKHE
jgi:hypothetical protein